MGRTLAAAAADQCPLAQAWPYRSTVEYACAGGGAIMIFRPQI